jgi:hypothetical protein
MRNVLIALLLITLIGCNEGTGNDSFARTLAVVGIGISIVGVIISVANHFWDRRKHAIAQAQRQEDKDEKRREKEEEQKAKEEAKRQRVKATLGVNIMADTPTMMTVEIVSLCDFDIPIEKVQIESEDEGRILAIPFNIRDGRVLRKGWKLEAHGKVTFFLQGMPEQFVKLFLNLKSTDFWVAIHSIEKEIERIPGSFMQPLLQQLSHVKSFVQ